MIHNPQSAMHNRDEPTLQQCFHDLNMTSSHEAIALAEQGEHASLWKLLFLPLVTFARVYTRQGEWRRGVAGVIVACFSSYAVFVRYAKLWEYWRLKTTLPTPPEK
jgi:hypothetical protein